MSDTLKQRAAVFAALPENDGGIVDDMLVKFANRELETLTKHLATALDGLAETATNPDTPEHLQLDPAAALRVIEKFRTEIKELRANRQPVNVIFDGPPTEAPRFVGVETDDGKPVDIGAFQSLAWYKRLEHPEQWALRITELPKAGT